MKFDLGGVGRGGAWTTVNLWGPADLKEDILNIDGFCKDGEVEAFRMFHTYEHIPVHQMPSFMGALLRKLKSGGQFIIKHTDAKRVLEMYARGELSFYAMRDLLFTGYYIRSDFVDVTGRDLQAHQYMWGAEELKADLLSYGFASVEIHPPDSWVFNLESHPLHQHEDHRVYHGVRVPNLYVVGTKA